MSKKKSSDSSSSGSGGSYDGPIVKVAKFRASTAHLPDLLTKNLPILLGPSLRGGQPAVTRSHAFSMKRTSTGGA